MPQELDFSVNKLITGDNLAILKTLDSDTVDIIYLDPPFFSNRNYEVIWGDAGEIRSFQDRWAGGIDHYIAWLKERVAEMHRVLKPTGSIFLHCDWHANAYIRVDILDKIFGADNFRGEIVWQRHNAHNDARKKLAVLKDTIWYYSKTETFKYMPVFTALSEKYTNKTYRFQDERGQFRSSDLTGAGINKNDIPWKGYNPSERNRHWAIPEKPIEDILGKTNQLSTIEKLELLEKNNYIIWSSKGTPSFKRYLETSNGVLVGDVWTDIQNVQSQAKERIGYPTQKPEALLERIINMASNEGDIVLDPFMGGGTAIAVADKLKRQWIGIDQSPMAVKVTDFRLQKQTDLFTAPYTVQLYKYDYDTLRYKDAFAFEAWIVQQFGGTPNAKQRGDFGVDGKASDGAPIQVKRSDNIGRNVLDNFIAAVQRFDKALLEKNISAKKPIGYIIAFSFGKGAIEEAARLKNKEDRIIKLVRVDEIIPIAVKPSVELRFKELEKDSKGNRRIEGIAVGKSPAGIEFYSWDFSFDPEKGFKPEVIIDKEGKQIISLKTGRHSIAVKVVDNEGLENMETIGLNINGAVKQIT